MASFNFTVDTQPMASEINSVSRNVDTVSGAVVAMQAAVIEAEKAGADHVCENVNRGFYSLIHSQISRKIAQLTGSVEVKLMTLVEYANSLRSIQGIMKRDYDMMSVRYGKLFKAINNSLEVRASEKNSEVFTLAGEDVRFSDSRTKVNAAMFTVNQKESVQSSQMISNAVMMGDAGEALAVIASYLHESAVQSRKTEDSMHDKVIDSMEDIYLPVSVVESANPEGESDVNYYVARSGCEEIDESIDFSVREQSRNSVDNGMWVDADGRDMERIEAEFRRLVAGSGVDERVRGEIERMFRGGRGIKRLYNEL